MDVLLVHIPKFNNFYNPIGHFVLGNTMPMGLLAIADHLDRNQIAVRVLHLGVEKLRNPGFRLSREIARFQPRLVAFDLHWHHQLSDVLRQTRQIRNTFPGIPLALGGHTASYYADELLASCPEVDFVIRGEGETPLLELTRQLQGELKEESVPNLSFRKNGQIRHNPIGFVANQTFLNELTFHRYDLLENAEDYIHTYSQVLWSRSLPHWLNKRMFRQVHLVGTGRGCPVECSYCSGGAESNRRITGRDRVVMRSVESVIAELKALSRWKIRRVYFPFDPYPHSDYYPRLFQQMKNENLSFLVTFESFGLPGDSFLDSFAQAFQSDPGNQILISAETGDETLRNRNRGYPFSNDALLACLDRMEKLGIHFFISYTLGLPGETRQTLEATRQLWNRIGFRYRNLVGQNGTLINLDPGSPADRNPEQYQIQVRPRTLADLIEAHRVSHRESLSGWGHFPMHHECPDLLPDQSHNQPRATEQILQKVKCRNFCPFTVKLKIPYPLNRGLCACAGAMFRLHRRIRGFHRNRLD